MSNILNFLFKYQEELKAELVFLSECEGMIGTEDYKKKVLILKGKAELILQMAIDLEKQKKAIK